MQCKYHCTYKITGRILKEVSYMGRSGLKRVVGRMVFALAVGGLTVSYAPMALAQTFPDPSRSTSIALTSDDRRLIVVNLEMNSVSIIQVRREDGQDDRTKLGEIVVGDEPRYVAIMPNDSTAYV